jgi:hypothetical protein
MTDKLKDAEDRLLEAMFRPEPTADEGFSRRVVARIRSRVWLRRLALPAAILVGGSIALKPLLDLAAAATALLSVLPQGPLVLPAPWIPSMQVVVLGAMLFIAMMLGLVED